MTLYAYDLGTSLFDVKEGANGYCDGEALAACDKQDEGLGQVDCGETRACNAGPGLDGPSGVGAPRGLGAFKPQPPIAVIAPPRFPANGEELSFSGSGSRDPYRAGMSYSWNWGDASAASSGNAPTHTYATPGTYLVTLTVSDSYGLTGTTSTAVEVLTAEQAKKAQEEAAKKAQEAEEELKKAQEEQAAKKAQEEEAKRAQEEQAKKAQEEATAAALREAERSLLTANVPGSVPPAVKPRVPAVTLASASLVASPSGSVTVKVACPTGVGSCEGTLTLRTFGPVSTASHGKAKAAVMTLATGSFTAEAGKVKALTLHLSAKARRLLARTHRLRARSTIVAHDPVGARATTQALATLRLAKAKPAKR